MVDVDLTFCKVKIKKERRITYAMFLEAIGIMALKKFPNLVAYTRRLAINMVNTLARVEGATQAEVQDLEDRIKFCYMLQDEVAGLISDLPRGFEAYRRMCKEVELLSANLEASVKVMAKVQLQRSAFVAEDSPQKRENAVMSKLFPNGMALDIQETMKQIMQAERDRVQFGQVLQEDVEGDKAESIRTSEVSDLCLTNMDAESFARRPC
ncbi:hypothetical protein DYB32_002814 [Aphanomyces invadans]|uniref:Uncharacterized protein n=1 Tax=Aphanomyces invadans TaxID=157072 RepID=A0A418B263_9STRA|nr:hypothetical protein DYB32_002814 [Aphanomyces invadans]